MPEFGTHLCQDAHQFLPFQQHVIGPLDLGFYPTDFPDSLYHSHCGQQGHLGRFLGQERGFQQYREPQSLALGAEPAPSQPAFTSGLFLSHTDSAVGSPLLRQFLQHFIGTDHTFFVADVTAQEPGMELFSDFRGQQLVRCAGEYISLFRKRFDAVSLFLQDLDVLPDGCPGNAQGPGQFFPGNRFRSLVTQDLQDFIPHSSASLRFHMIVFKLTQLSKAGGCENFTPPVCKSSGLSQLPFSHACGTSLGTGATTGSSAGSFTGMGPMGAGSPSLGSLGSSLGGTSPFSRM